MRRLSSGLSSCNSHSPDRCSPFRAGNRRRNSSTYDLLDPMVYIEEVRRQIGENIEEEDELDLLA